nr:GNAT family N-acetyltransferase [Novosphingobium sp. SG720]
MPTAVEPKFRLATLADLPALRTLVERAYRGDTARQGWTHEADLLDDERTSDAELAAALAAADKRVIVAEAGDGALVGTVTLVGLPGSKAYLGMLCVDPDVQAGGLGRALLAQCDAMAKTELGARAIEMTVIDRRPELIAWYERRGYVRTGETRPFPGTMAVDFAMVVLERPLT